MKKNLQKLANAMHKCANALSEDARSQWDEMTAAVEALIAEDTEHNVTELNDKLAEIEAKYAKQNEEVAEKLNSLRAEIKRNNAAPAEDRLTADIKNQIAIALRTANKAGQESAVMEVLKKNDISGLSFPDGIKATISYERKPTEIFDEFGTTDIDEHFWVGIDETNAAQIAKQFSSDASVQKDIQNLAAEGVVIRTAYIGKLQRFSNAALDKAEKAGTLNEVLNQTTAELEYMTNRLAEKAAIVGDNVNLSGKKVTTFETIGTTKASNAKVTVVNPASANNPTILDIAKTADAVDAPVSEKIAVLSKDLARELSAFLYGQGGSTRILSDEDIASQIGVRKIVKVDYLSEVTGLHAVVLKPQAYKVQTVKEHSVAWPEWRNNAQYFIFEKNMGGALVELKSAAVLREAE